MFACLGVSPNVDGFGPVGVTAHHHSCRVSLFLHLLSPQNHDYEALNACRADLREVGAILLEDESTTVDTVRAPLFYTSLIRSSYVFVDESKIHFPMIIPITRTAW